MAWSLWGGSGSKPTTGGGAAAPSAPTQAPRKPNPFFHSEYSTPLWVAVLAIGLSLYLQLMWLGDDPSVARRFASYILPLVTFAVAANLAWDIKQGRVRKPTTKPD